MLPKSGFIDSLKPSAIDISLSQLGKNIDLVLTHVLTLNIERCAHLEDINPMKGLMNAPA